MASAAGCTPLTWQILPSHLSISSYPEVDLALTQWNPDGDLTPPSSSNKAKQKALDLSKVQASYEFLVNTSQGPVARARLALRMDDDAISICVGLHLQVGVPYVAPTSVVSVVYVCCDISLNYNKGKVIYIYIYL